MQEEFVGTGWSFPMGVSATGGIAMVRREVELEQAMRLILATYPGERPLRPMFGSRIRDFVFREVTEEMMAEIASEVQRSLLRWEPRVNVPVVVVTQDQFEPSLVFIDVQYVIKGENDPRNLVFPFYSIPEDGTPY